ncbi:MAG: sugar ABC transporter permease [Chloroflexi bacterium]|nr:sugar ABC transporter permease [Chloroflexota bacterium]MCL5275077.1 sugar ABC transporter permease [Chloroflexota bacterium]
MQKREKWKLIIPFVLPALILFTVFTMYPAVRGLYISLFKWTGLTQNMTFIGLNNFSKLWRELTDPADFYNIRLYLSHNAFIFVFSLVTIILALVVATVINNKVFGHKAFRVTYFFPNVLSVAAIAVLWSMILNPSFGLINGILRSIGLEQLALPWLSLQYEMPLFKLGLYSVGFIGIWGGLGWYMILFLAAIQNVPQELIESAMLDGANRVRMFWSVTIPLIWETIRTVLIFAVIGALNQFALVYILFEQTPNKHSDMIMNYYYFQAFAQRNWGYAAAIVVIIFIVTLIGSLVSYRVSARETVQY